MARPLRRLFRHVLVYGAGRLGIQLFVLLTLPIMTRILTPADYGVIEAVATMMSVVAIFATLSLDSAVQRSYYDYAPEQVTERKRVVSTALWATVAWSGAIAAGIILGSRALSGLLFGSSKYAS